MREILFRGKRTDNGEWVEGYYCPTVISNTPIIFPINYFQGVEVNPETIEQYTGLKDKNGKKIFEGDILEGETIHYGGYAVLVKKHIGYVFWDKNKYSIASRNTDSLVKVRTLNYSENPNEIIIGNIYDNPELLKV